MIKHLSGDFETVEYDSKRSVLLYDNTDNEAYPVHWHSDLEIIMSLKNHYITNVSGTDYDIHENEVLIVPPGEMHSMPAVPGRRLIFQCGSQILTGSTTFEPLMRALSSPVLITAGFDRELQTFAQRTMLDIFELYSTKSELADVRIYSLIMGLLIELREHQLRLIAAECDDDRIDEYSEKFALVFHYIDANYMYDITLEQLAAVAGYSKYHFSRIFKQYNSMSYIQYINARRTKAAEQLLMDPEMPITEVAMRSGFKSLTTFNRIFKEIKHCTPSDYKRCIQLVKY